MFPVKIYRPVAVFDIEATGITTRADRIVELAVIKMMPDGTRESHSWRIKPGIPIPSDATAIHGITNEDVANCPVFKEVADEILQCLDNCDLCGYNLARFDIPMLTEEFIRVGIKFDIENRKIIDPQRIFHQKEPRDLSAAVRYYCNEELVNAHGAEADVDATIRVLQGQYEKYDDLPDNLDELDEFCNPRSPDWADRSGRLKWSDGNIVLNFGKMKGGLLKDVVQKDPGFIKWMLRSDFPRDTKDIVSNAMEGIWPDPPKKSE